MTVWKKFLLVAGGILILLVGIAVGEKFNNKSPSLFRPLADVKNLSAGLGEKLGGGNSGVELFKVGRVIDGDTIELENGERIRYIGIDTPETVDPRKPVECFGIEASRKNKELVEGKAVRLEKDITERDKYQRLLRYVWAGDVFVNMELVKQGFAHSYSYPPDVKYREKFAAAEREARAAKAGLWGACPAGRKMTAAPDGTKAASPSCRIKGNISSSGEKIYHLPGCSFYAKTQIDESRGERWFCSEAEAQTAGWRRAFNCP